MNTCGDCDFWGLKFDSEPNEDPAGRDFRPCGNLPEHRQGPRTHAWEDVDTKWWIDWDDYEPGEEDACRIFKTDHLAFTEDASGFYSALKTAEDFGCNRWDGKVERVRVGNTVIAGGTGMPTSMILLPAMLVLFFAATVSVCS